MTVGSGSGSSFSTPVDGATTSSFERARRGGLLRWLVTGLLIHCSGRVSGRVPSSSSPGERGSSFTSLRTYKQRARSLRAMATVAMCLPRRRAIYA